MRVSKWILAETDEDDGGRYRCQGVSQCLSEMTGAMWKEYEVFGQRDLSGFFYLFLDAVYESMRFYQGPKEGIPVAWGITQEGHRVLLHLMLGNKESYEHWRELL